ncbi:unnamed protein product [Durusdinium trenchii]|uniref:EGF-like domain-containing protein n=1 Tax=Durusdinium trenchii TaxID=1381693 RepID=A0ABP0LQP2_9DINO
MAILVSWFIVAPLVNAAPKRIHDNLRVGTFLSGLTRHPLTDEEFPLTATREFIDLMKHSTPFEDGVENGIIGDDSSWVHYNWPENFTISFRRDGYPESLPQFTMWGSLRQSSVKATIGAGGAFIEDGEYVATWEGRGNVSWEGDASLLQMEDSAARVLVRPKSGIIVRIIETDEADPLHALTLIPVAYAGNVTQIFHPHFLQKLNGTSVLRFSSWQMVDMWDHDGSLTRNWDNRTLPTDQTQAGLGGVCVEYMVELANRLGADPWFSMPKAAETESDSVDPYAMAFALLVNQTLDSNLRIYVEYRSCCRAGLAPGWDSDNAVQSLVLWKSWEQAGVDPSRVVNVMSALQQLTKLYGSSVTSVEAAAIDVSFSDVCKYGETPCVDFNSLEANGTYGGLTPLELIDAVIRPAMLKQEVEINARVQQALYYGFEIIAFNAMPLISARSYGHRGNLNWALGCESCLMSALGRRYGARERSQLAVDGWVHEVDFEAYKAYQGLQEEDRALDDQGSYWLVGSPSEAKAHCQAMSECDGFSYYKSGEWSCGVGNDFRYGDCVTPGAAYFFKRTRIQSGERKPPTHCSAFTVPGDPYNQCVTGRMDSYFKADAEIPGFATAAEADLAARASCVHKCQIAYTPAPWDPPAEGFTLDDLREILPAVIAAAEGEQKLENMMIEAFRDPVMEDLMLEYLERLRLIGFSTVVGGQMVRQARLCRTGGKACGQASVMLHWDDDSPIRRAMTGYVQGRRATPEKPSPPAPSCPQRCIYGICELGSCKCWKGASGADCSILAPVECHRGRRLGLSLSGVSYWTREWIFVDVFKHVGEWIAQELTSYDWNTGTELDLRSDGYPARLELNQVATLLTVRDVERHYVGGWYTVIYDGEGILDFSMDVTCVHRMSRNHIQIYVNLTTGLNNGIGIRLTDTNEADPVRNIRIVTPGFEETYETSPFHPAFLASLENFTVLRFMDWMHANSGNTPEEWEDRVTPSYYTQGSHPGVSLEYMVRLSNEVGAEPWFSVPVNATDDYIQNFVQYVSDNLRPDLGIYIELGNEAWHPKFFGGQWAQQQGAAEGLSQLCWYAKRSGEMAQITKSVIGSSRNVTAVANTQASNWDAMSQLLQCEGINDMDAFGVGPYFNGYNLLPNPDADLDLVLSSYESEVNTSIQWVRDHKVALEGTKFKLVSYESGPAGEGDGSANDLAIQAHRNPRMKQILRTYLEELNKDLDLMVYFASCGKPSQYGSWGMIEAMDQPREDAYKYQAVQEFLSSGMPPSCSVERQDCEAADGCSGNGLCGVDDQCYCYRGFSGTTCLDASFTDYSSCGYRCTFDQGICQVSEVIGNLRSWACNCRAEYSGGKCSRFSCPNGCNQRGHCIASSVCSCFRGYRGSQCEIDCGCGHHGQCDSNNECICDQGWRKSAVGCEWDCSTVDTLGCTGPGQSACSACQYGTCIDGQCHCWAGYYGTDCSTLDSNLLAHKGAAFGINVATTPSTFVDVMKTTRHWTSIWDADTQPGQFSYQGGSVMWTSRQYEWGNGLEINETFDGYVASLKQDQALITLALRDVCLHAPHGRYVVTYDGDGEIDFAMDANPVAFQKGRIDVDFQPTCRRECWFDKANWLPYCSDNGIAITIRRVNPSNPLRNVRIIMPGFFATHELEPFHPWFLKNLERFSTVRLMDWTHINSEHFIKRTPYTARYVRFTSTATHGGGIPRMSELLLKTSMGELLSCMSSVLELCDGDPGTDWAPVPVLAATEYSVIVELAEGSAISSYMWMTSGWNRRVDPVMWRLEVSEDNQTWTVADERSTLQPITYYRRRIASFGSPEEDSWYPLRKANELWEWADRVLPSHRSQTTGPVALEYQVLLVNTLGASPWVTVHHLASDDYVRQEASFWLQHLRPDVQVYVEHSNEVWNPLFPQGRYATQKGTELGLVDGTCRTPHCGRVRYNAYRSKQIFDIWADVWSSGSRSRLKFVISTQAVWGDATNDLLSLNSGAGADLLGITGYMSPQGGIDQSYSAKTPAEVIELFTSGKESARSWVKEQKAIADAAGLGITFYEGGVGLVEDGTIETGQAIGAITELLMATGRSAAFQGAVEAWLDMFREELGDALFMYFVDTGFWSKYGQWGNREYYDAATATSPAAAAVGAPEPQNFASGLPASSKVHAYLDRLAGSRPACVAQNSAGRGLPPDSFLGPPAVWKPARGDILVKGKRYKLSWGDPERLPIDLLLDFHLWQRSSCPGEAASDIHLGFANAAAGTFTWEVPSSIEAGDEYFVELRARAPAAFPSNYSSFFSVVNQVDAPPTYLLYVENDVDLLSAFHRDCKKGDEWAIQPHFRISSCVYSSAEGCRQYRTSRSHDGPPPYLHGSGLPLKDCTLHVVGLRQTLRLEGLTRGFDLTAEDSLARAVSNASQLPPGAIAITVVGGSAGRRLAEATGVVTLELSMTSDDSGVGSAALSLSSLSSNTIFLGEAASALGAPSLSVVTGNLSAVDGSSAEVVVQYLQTETTSGDTSTSLWSSMSGTQSSTSSKSPSTSSTTLPPELNTSSSTNADTSVNETSVSTVSTSAESAQVSSSTTNSILGGDSDAKSFLVFPFNWMIWPCLLFAALR